MLLIESPTLSFAFIFTIFSITLTLLTFNLASNQSEHHIQFLIIFPPLNSIFLFLFSLTWIERRFRLSYIPFISLIILLSSCLTLTIISSLFLSLSIIFYFNFLFYFFFSILFFFVISILIISYSYGLLSIHSYSNVEQQNNELSKTNHTFQIDKLLLKSNDNNEFILYMSKLPGRQIRNITDDLNQINVDTILTLNEPKELSLMNRANKNLYNMDTYSMHIKRANIEHILYPIRARFIPKSISDYIRFLYSIIVHMNRFNRSHLLVHCMSGMGRTGMTAVCFELMYEYIMNSNEEETKQKFLERFCHYPFLLPNYCRVCQSISNVRKARIGTIHNPLQILFIHEFYSRLKSSSYMQQIKNIINLDEKLLLNNFEELRVPLQSER